MHGGEKALWIFLEWLGYAHHGFVSWKRSRSIADACANMRIHGAMSAARCCPCGRLLRHVPFLPQLQSPCGHLPATALSLEPGRQALNGLCCCLGVFDGS